MAPDNRIKKYRTLLFTGAFIWLLGFATADYISKSKVFFIIWGALMAIGWFLFMIGAIKRFLYKTNK